MDFNSEIALENFINMCDELMIPATEGTAEDILKELAPFQKRIYKLEKEIKKSKGSDPKTQIQLLKQLKVVLNDAKTTINKLPDAEDEKWRKILGWISVLFVPWFIGIPVGVYLIRSVHSKRDAIKFIDTHISAADSKIRELQA